MIATQATGTTFQAEIRHISRATIYPRFMEETCN